MLTDVGRSASFVRRFRTAAVFTSAKNGSEDYNEYGALLEKHWQQKTEVLEDKTTPVTLRAPQISHVPTRARTPAATVTAGDWPLEPRHGLCQARQTILRYFSDKCSPISERAEASSPCPSDNNSCKMMSMEYYWNNTDKEEWMEYRIWIDCTHVVLTV